MRKIIHTWYHVHNKYKNVAIYQCISMCLKVMYVHNLDWDVYTTCMLLFNVCFCRVSIGCAWDHRSISTWDSPPTTKRPCRQFQGTMYLLPLITPHSLLNAYCHLSHPFTSSPLSVYIYKVILWRRNSATLEACTLWLHPLPRKQILPTTSPWTCRNFINYSLCSWSFV